MTPARGALYIATAGALALMARSILREPIPMWLAAVALGGYVGLILCGVLILRLGMFVDVVSRGPRDARGVALTFDDGPSPEHTPKVLDLLDAAGVKATFFVIGRKAKVYPDLVREIVARGHAVGIHGYAHDRLFSLRTPESIRIDLARALEVVSAASGQTPTLFRPPIGHTSPRIAGALEAFDFTVVGWSVRGLDGLRGARADRVAARIVPHLRDGAIVLLHDAAEYDDFTPASVAALPRILGAMARKNLAGVRVDAWLDAVPDAEAAAPHAETAAPSPHEARVETAAPSPHEARVETAAPSPPAPRVAASASAADHHPDVVDRVGPHRGSEAAEGEDHRQEQAAYGAERE